MSTVSVIVPWVQRNERWIDVARLSVIGQSKPAEYIRVDGTDRTVGAATNEGVRRASGDYVMRLDSDDWLHPECCLVMSAYLDTHPGVAAVYSDFWEADEDGNVLAVGEQPNIPHPACMLIRRSVFTELRGMNEKLEHQDGTEWWMRLRDFTTHHLSIPLWYYRQHPGQMSRAHNRKVQIGHDVREVHGVEGPRILCVIPARGGSKGVPRKNLVKIDGVPLVARAIRTAKKCRHDMLIAVSTEDEEIGNLARAEGVEVIERPASLAEDDVSLIPVAAHAADAVDYEWPADIVITLQPTAALLERTTIDDALDKLTHEHADSVVAVTELGRHPYRAYMLDANGRLQPYFPAEAEMFLQRQDRPAAYGFVGLYVRRRRLLADWDGRDFALGRCYGVVVPPAKGIDIDTPLDLWLAQAIVQHQGDV